jgi:hypothetical protein
LLAQPKKDEERSGLMAWPGFEKAFGWDFEAKQLKVE